MVTVVVPLETMSRGFVGRMITSNVSFSSTMSSPKMAMAVTQTPWPSTVVDGITTCMSSSMKSAVSEAHIKIREVAYNLGVSVHGNSVPGLIDNLSTKISTYVQYSVSNQLVAAILITTCTMHLEFLVLISDS